MWFKIVLLIFLPLSLLAADVSDKILYKQNKYQLEDYEGDQALMDMTRFSLDVIKAGLFKHTDKLKQMTLNLEAQSKKIDVPLWNQVDEEAYWFEGVHSDLRVTQSIEGSKKPISAKKLAQSLLAVIQQEECRSGIKSSTGVVHQWTERTLKESKINDQWIVRFPKLLVALGIGMTSRVLITERESILTDWLLKQDNRSVLPHELFRQSYRIHEGDIYLSLLCIENVLSQYWLVPNRENLRTTLKLKPITNFLGNDSSNNGDTFGAWYHLFGLILYGYADGGLSAVLVSKIENFGSHIINPGKERQEDWINWIGAVTGGYLKQGVMALKNKHYEVQEYLVNNEDLRPLLKKEFSNDFEANLVYSGIEIRRMLEHDVQCNVTFYLNSGVGQFPYQKFNLGKRRIKASSTSKLNFIIPRGTSKSQLFLDQCDDGNERWVLVK